MMRVWILSVAALIGCDETAKEASDCRDENAAIIAAQSRVNHCGSDFDCRVTGVNPHCGCAIYALPPPVAQDASSRRYEFVRNAVE